MITAEAGTPGHPEWYPDEFGRLLIGYAAGTFTAHMRRLCQVFAGSELGCCRFCGCLMVCALGLRRALGVSAWAHALMAAGPGERRAGSWGAERSRSDAAGARDADRREPIMGRPGGGLAGHFFSL